jgi:hypothetical protein
VSLVAISVGHGRQLHVAQAHLPAPVTLRRCRWRVRPHRVLAPARAGAPRLTPGNESERFGSVRKKRLGDPAQRHQHLGDAQTLAERR